jgi:hypothetical protein
MLLFCVVVFAGALTSRQSEGQQGGNPWLKFTSKPWLVIKSKDIAHKYDVPVQECDTEAEAGKEADEWNKKNPQPETWTYMKSRNPNFGLLAKSQSPKITGPGERPFVTVERPNPYDPKKFQAYNPPGQEKSKDSWLVGTWVAGPTKLVFERDHTAYFIFYAFTPRWEKGGDKKWQLDGNKIRLEGSYTTYLAIDGNQLREGQRTYTKAKE